MRVTHSLLLLLFLVACAARPPRPALHDPARVREIEQCDYLYSQCLGTPSALAPTDFQPNPLDWKGDPEWDCNKRLRSCYDRARETDRPGK
jgi:hypothetical protein